MTSLAGIGVAAIACSGLFHHPAHRPPTGVSPQAQSIATGTPHADHSRSRPPVPVDSPATSQTNGDGVEQFARLVAERVFTWDTTTGTTPGGVVGTVVGLGDPVYGELDGLASDATAYLPTVDVWATLTGYQTRQTITDMTVSRPAGWDQALAQAGEGQLVPGTAAVTVDGTRVRDGIWAGTVERTEHPVAVTVFAVCSPDSGCRLLRLSAPGTPLR
jgi:hypothetical protein